MVCRVCSSSITALLDDELTPAARREVEAHLEACAPCRDEYESLLYSYQVVETVDSDQLSLPPWESIEERIQPRRHFWDPRWLFSPAWATAAAGLMLMISLPFLWTDAQDEARFSQQFSSYIAEREQIESLHEGIIRTEPVGWVTYNPFKLREATQARNPFSE